MFAIPKRSSLVMESVKHNKKFYSIFDDVSDIYELV
jgi:hypothetical protein